jgi:hypothetical protein
VNHPRENDGTWRGKCHRLISVLCEASYRRANPVPRKRHRPYVVPQLASDLIYCLDRDDEVEAKRLFHSYEGMKAIEVKHES